MYSKKESLVKWSQGNPINYVIRNQIYFIKLLKFSRIIYLYIRNDRTTMRSISFDSARKMKQKRFRVQRYDCSAYMHWRNEMAYSCGGTHPGAAVSNSTLAYYTRCTWTTIMLTYAVAKLSKNPWVKKWSGGEGEEKFSIFVNFKKDKIAPIALCLPL